jgi:hypothetical protein
MNPLLFPPVVTSSSRSVCWRCNLSADRAFSSPQPSLTPPPHTNRSIMEFVLRCNDLKCRSQLRDRAVVTTCRYVRSSTPVRLEMLIRPVMYFVRRAQTLAVSRGRQTRIDRVQHVLHRSTIQMTSWLPASIHPRTTRRAFSVA